MSIYQHATNPQPAPQSIPAGFAGRYDWSEIEDEEKARRGWVRFDPPFHDPVHDQIETSFSKGEGGIWQAAYAVVPGPAELALAAAKATVSARRWEEQIRGVSVAIAGKATRFLSTKEGQTDIGNALQLAQAAEAQAGAPGSFSTTWKSLDGFVTVKLADLVAIGMAIGAHVTACFTREGAIAAKLDTAAGKRNATAHTVRDVLTAEIDKGWPAG